MDLDLSLTIRVSSYLKVAKYAIPNTGHCNRSINQGPLKVNQAIIRALPDRFSIESRYKEAMEQVITWA